jgi:hypothetical protein
MACRQRLKNGKTPEKRYPCDKFAINYLHTFVLTTVAAVFRTNG